jgi:hypothetical protein
MSFPMAQPFPGGAVPIYNPPIASKWILAALIVFAGAVADRWSPQIRALFVHPVGFFLTALLAIAAYQVGFPPAAFAILFLLLNVWATTLPATEGFLSGASVDWVSNNNTWFVEKVMREKPKGIQEKDVETYPVEGP